MHILPFVVSASDVSDTSVGSEDNNRSCFTFESPVKERKAFHIKHVNLIDEENSRHNFCLSLLAPFRDLLIDLLSNLLSDFSSGTGEEGKKALRA